MIEKTAKPMPLVADGDIRAIDVAVLITRMWPRAILSHGQQKPLTVGMMELLLYSAYGCSFVFNGEKLFDEYFYAEDGTVKIPTVCSVFGHNSKAVAKDLDTASAISLCVPPRDGFTGPQMQLVGAVTTGLRYYDENHLREILLGYSDTYSRALSYRTHMVLPADIKSDFIRMYTYTIADGSGGEEFDFGSKKEINQYGYEGRYGYEWIEDYRWNAC